MLFLLFCEHMEEIMGLFDFLKIGDSLSEIIENMQMVEIIPFDIESLEINNDYVILDGTKYAIDNLKEKKFKNVSGEKWIPGCSYISHPINTNHYIEKNCFKDYILREMLNDVVNYILDNFGVSLLVVGIVVNKDFNGELGVSIPVCNINSEAKLNISVSQDYTVRGTEYEKSKIKHEYTWIKKFPEIKTAVEHNAKSFERIENIDSSLTASLGFDVPYSDINASCSQNKKLSIYISYTK